MSSPEQLLNVPSPIVLTESGILNDPESPVQLINVYCPIVVTELGIVNEVNP